MKCSVDFLLSLHVLIGLLSFSHSQVPTTVPTVPSTASAKPGWTVQYNYRTYGGTQQPGVNTLLGCQTNCEEDLSCSGIDWDYKNQVQQYCWFSGSGDSYAADGIDRWIYTRTSGSTSSNVGATSGSSTVATTAFSNQFCDNTTWIETKGFSYAHTIGQIIYGMNNSRCCLYLCEATPSCRGYDWYSNDSTCALWNTSSGWNTSRNTKQEADSSIDHYFAIKNLTNCNAYAIDLIDWQAMVNTHAGSGMNQHLITVWDNCLSGCQNDPSCRGFDWDESNAGYNCWFHFGSYPDPIPASGLTLYIKQDSRNHVSPAPNSAAPTIAPLQFDCSVYLPTTTTTTAKPTTTSKGSPSNKSNPAAAASNFMDSSSLQPFAIKPAYIVLAGLGAGCVLMMVVGIVTLCQYKLHAEDKLGEYNGFRDSGTLPAYRTNAVENYAMTDTMVGGGSILGGDTIVENNPYYNHDDMDAKDDRYGFD